MLVNKLLKETMTLFKVPPEVHQHEIKYVCRDFMNAKCNREGCRFIHDTKLCNNYWKRGSCKFGEHCRKNHFVVDNRDNQNRDNQNRDNQNRDNQRGDKYNKNTQYMDNQNRDNQRRDEYKKDTQYMDNQNRDNQNRDNQNRDNKHNRGTTQYNRYNQSQYTQHNQRRKPKNTESYEPWTEPFDMRIMCDLGIANEKMSAKLTSRDVLLVPNLFKDFETGELYERLVSEIDNCKVPKEDLLKLWHGSEHLNIEGKHHICNDRTNWKQECPTFTMVIDRMKEFFGVTVEATRLNWYKDGTEYKPRHHDAAAVDPRKAAKQNITIGLSFSKGDLRDIVFENVRSRQAICIPQGDGDIYTFGNQVNVEWKHGVNPGVDSSLGRISIIIWGWVDGINSQ